MLLTSHKSPELKLLRFGAGPFLLIILFLISFGYLNFSRKASGQKWVNHTLSMIDALQLLETRVQETGSTGRAWFITGQESYLRRMNELQKEIHSGIRELEKGTVDNPIQQRNIGKLQEAAATLREHLGTSIRLAGEGKKAEIIEKAKLGTGQDILAKIITIIQEMKAEEQKILNLRLQEFDRAENITALVILLASLLSFVLLVSGFLFIRRQLLRRMKVEADLNQLAQIQKTVLESAAFALIAVNLDGKIRLFNPAAEKLLGYTADEVLGKFPSIFHDPSEMARMADILSSELGEAIPVGMDVFTARPERGIIESDQWTYIRKDGTRIPVKLTISPLRGQSGELTGYLGIAYDITKQLEAEEALIEAKDAALLANKAKSEFLANMSHEIRTPMNAIMGMAELLKETELSDEQKKYVEIFGRAGENLLNIINDILDLSKIEAGHFELDKSPFTLSSIVEKSVELISLRAHQKQLELAVDVSDGLPDHFVGDGNRLRQILLNVLGNAVKFTRRGEIVLSIKPGEPIADRQVIMIEVQDTGIGMTSDQIRKLFDRFTQADSSITKEFGGTGLGLSITKRLVELMDGRIEVQSASGIGTRFTLSITLDKDQSFLEEPQEMELSGDRVLVVDDSRTNRMILRKLLEGRNALVTEADGGERALDLIKEHNEKGLPFNLILLDCRMPGMDGFEVARAIRNDPALQGPLLLMITSDNRPGDIKRSRDLGFRSFLIKPVMKKDLFSAIQKSIIEKMDPQQTTMPAEEADAPKNLNILLADDNEENRLVISSFLKGHEWKIDEAKNGRDALLLFQQNRYDIIFMDMQMPVMDGYTATKEIRKLEQERREGRTPVIALTAFALKEEMEKSLLAGCDDHVTKPVSKATLLSTIGRFTKEYMFRVDTDLREIVPDYLERRRAEVREFRKLIDSKDYPTVQKLGHKLRGSAGSYGFPILSEAGKEFEEGARDGDYQRLARALTMYETVMARIRVKYS